MQVHINEIKAEQQIESNFVNGFVNLQKEQQIQKQKLKQKQNKNKVSKENVSITYNFNIDFTMAFVITQNKLYFAIL